MRDARIGQIIRKYRRMANLTQPALAKALARAGIEISYKTISGWEKGLSEPSVSTFMQLCRILEIPDFLLEYFGENPADPMSQLNDEGRLKVRSYIDSLLNPVSYRRTVPASAAPSEAHLRRLRLYDVRVSAGTGNFLDSDQYTLIDVDSAKAQEASYAVSIAGDSMEPLYHDHDMVFVREQPALESGEIGIFYLNDDAYIKKFRDDEGGVFLISLNPKYAPIPVDPDRDSFRIFGKVL